MEFDALFSNVVGRMKPSIIRALLKMTQKPDVISFAGGIPDGNLFPAESLSEISQKVVRNCALFSLQYGESQGLDELREQIAIYLKKRGIETTAENILITTGSQQGIDLAGRLFLAENRSIYMEEPGYLGALISFRNQGADLISVPVEIAHDPQALDVFLKNTPVKSGLLYMVPSFQNPSSKTLKEDLRPELLEVLKKHDVILLEDDPYGELNFCTESLKPVKSWDTEGRVIYLGSFSKVLSPGLRLGYVCAHRDVIAKMTLAKETMDVSSSVLTQYIAMEYLKSGDMKKHVPQLINVYRSRSQAMICALKKECPNLKVEEPSGGFFIWLSPGGALESMELFNRALKNGVAFVPGSAFYNDEKKGANTMRLTFCTSTEEKINEGIRRLAEVLTDAGCSCR